MTPVRLVMARVEALMPTPLARAAAVALVLALALLAASCMSPIFPERTERFQRGPKAEDLFVMRTMMSNGREPSFDEKRAWQDRLEDRVSRYLREHPEVEQAPRYTDFRFWRHVSLQSARGEVRALLEEPDEQTIDPARMAAMAKHLWPDLQKKATEAWLYPLGWTLYFDDKGVVEMVRVLSGKPDRDE